MDGRKALGASVLAAWLASLAWGAPVYSSRDEALARAFPPPAIVERKSHFLSEDQRRRAGELARAEVPSGLVVAYTGRDGPKVLGTAYFDTHTVRTMSETLLVLVLPDGSAGRIEVLAFNEPEDYQPRSAWLRLFEGRSLKSGIQVGRGLAHVTGATLTTRAIASAVRRVLAVHHVLNDEPKQ